MDAKLGYEDLAFVKNKGFLRVIFLKRFYFDMPNSDLDSIGKWDVKNGVDCIEVGCIEDAENANAVNEESERKVKKNYIYFDCKQATAERKFNQIIDRKIQNDLYAANGSKAFYIFKGPLIGLRRFGIIESDSNCIELRPITGCNLQCIYCSVDEGPKTGKIEYVVDKDLLVNEFKKLAKLKTGDLYVHISAMGDPTLYPKLVELISDISKVDKVKIVTIGTNGLLLNKDYVDCLVDAGLNRINISINAIDSQLARKIAGVDAYDIERIKEQCKYIVTKIDLIIAPTLLHGINDEEIGKIIEFALGLEKIAKKHGKNVRIGIQNFLNYKGGRNAAEQWDWKEFYKFMHELENKYKIKLVNPDLGFEIKSDKVLKKPHKKGDLVVVERFNEELGFLGERLINIPKCNDKKAKFKLTSDKFNIYQGA